MLQVIPIILLFYVGLSLFSYTPALPSLSSEFETSNFVIKMSVVAFMLTYGFFKSLWLFISESISDKMILILSLLLSLSGLTLTMISSNITVFYIGRIVEAVGVCGVLVLFRCKLHQNIDQHRYSKFISNAVIYIFLACLIGPILGSYIFKHLGWRYIFGALLLLSLSINIFIVVSYMEIKVQYIHRSGFRNIFRDFYSLFGKRQLMGYILPCVITLGGCYSFFAISPYLFMNYMDYKITTYVYFNIPVIFAFILGDIFFKAFNKILSHYVLVVVAIIFLFFSAGTSLYFIGLNRFVLLSILLPMSLFMFASGIICPCCLDMSKKEAKDLEIEKAAFFPYLIFVVSAICTAIFAGINLFSPIAKDLYYFILSLLSIIIFFALARPSQKTPEEKTPEK